MDDNNDIMYRSIWYGEVDNTIEVEELWDKVNGDINEKDKLLGVIELLKRGEFSAKAILIDIMNKSNDISVINLCMRVFCSVVDHKDIKNVENLSILSRADEEIIRLFASTSKYTLSYEVVPYLLATLEEWEDSNVETTIRDALDWILNYQEYMAEDSAVDEIGEFYFDISSEIETGKYYYEGGLAFPGALTKELLDASAVSRVKGESLKLSIIPKMLSICSGVKCPVEYYTVVNDELMRDVIDYVKQLSDMNWERGCKYFYGHKID